MNTSKKWLSAVGVFVLGTSLAVAAPQGGEGHGWGGHGRHGRGQMGAKMAEKLNLSDAQKQQLKDMNQSFREQNKPLFQAFRQNMKDLRAAKQSNDTAKADSIKATLQSQRAELKQLRQQQQQRFLSILTPDQRAQFDQLKAERAARRAQHQHDHDGNAQPQR